MKKHFLLLLILLLTISVQAQFHTLKIPKASPHVLVTQQLGITDISIDYSSPVTKGRDVWGKVVPFEGKPIAWRAGANMNTRIKFSTEVTIDGESFPAGSYGFHIIPHKEGKWEILFAENDNMWGSYYLNPETDVFKSLKVEPTDCPQRENLTFDFANRTDSTVEISVQWGEKQIPFTVGVDLNKTVLESFRYELLGINTYRWEAWNDAARWCLGRKTNLEEALTWADRSINGGFNGFAANKNLTNLGTKMQILNALDRKDEITPIVEDAKSLLNAPVPAYYFGQDLLALGLNQLGKDFYETAVEKYPEMWFLHLGLGMSDYLLGNKNQAIKSLKSFQKKANPRAKLQLEDVIKKMETGTFSLK